MENINSEDSLKALEVDMFGEGKQLHVKESDVWLMSKVSTSLTLRHTRR